MIANYTSDCPLCRLAQDHEFITPIHFEDDRIIVVDCIVCHVPMIVLKAHRSAFTPEEADYVREYCRTMVFGKSVIDWEQRKIPDHAHCHIRPFPFPGTTNWEMMSNGSGLAG